MNRRRWTARMLARHVRPCGLLGRPSLVLRMRADQWAPGLLDGLGRGWKYADLRPAGRRVELWLRGYAGETARPLLPAIVAMIADMQAAGVWVDVR